MASRLTRWAVASGLGLVAVFVATVPPGPSVILGEYSSASADGGPFGAAGLYAANEGALARARQELKLALRRRSLLTVAPRGSAPVVVRFEDTVARIDGPMTAAAESLWRGLPRAADAPRTLLLEERFVRRRKEWQGLSEGLCVAAFDSTTGPRTWTLRRTAGECALATRFGPAGRGFRTWLDSVGTVAMPTTHLPQGGRGAVTSLASLGAFDRVLAAGGLRWALSREQEACAGGRSDQCAEGLGFHDGRSRRIAPPWDNYRGRLGTAGLPSALLVDLGPERFQQLWRSDDPVPATYEHLTGRSFDRWAMSYVQDAVGRIEKENGLTALGWLGWLFWLGLVLFWFSVRVERRPAT